MNLEQVTADILAGHKSVQDGYERGQREQRLSRAIREAANALYRARVTMEPDTTEGLRELARELELAYAESRPVAREADER